jgi:hypothetical protein
MLRDITVRIHAQNGDLGAATKQAQLDSTTVKILTRVAVMFLPGSFMAVGNLRVDVLRVPSAEFNAVDYIQLQPHPNQVELPTSREGSLCDSTSVLDICDTLDNGDGIHTRGCGMD